MFQTYSGRKIKTRRTGRTKKQEEKNQKRTTLPKNNTKILL